MAGQNDRAYPGDRAVYRRQVYVVWPKSAASTRAGAEAAGIRRLTRRSDRSSVLEVPGLIKRFGGFTAVSNVSFKVDQGEILGLIGPNGSGKSTIFNMLSGTLAPTAGRSVSMAHEIGGLPPHRIINRGIGRTFQIPRPFQRLTMFENVALAGYYGQGQHIARESVRRGGTRVGDGRPAGDRSTPASADLAPPG
jgi:ABC-type glutathione transport system ATPase component